VLANGGVRVSTRIVRTASIVERAQRLAGVRASPLTRALDGATLDVLTARPREGSSTDVTLRLALAPRVLGRALASPEIHDALIAIVSAAVHDEAPSFRVVAIELASTGALQATSHPYRVAGALAERPPEAIDPTAHVREIVAGYFEAHASPPLVEVTACAGEIVIEIAVDSMIFTQLEPRLREAARRVAPKVLVHRARR